MIQHKASIVSALLQKVALACLLCRVTIAAALPCGQDQKYVAHQMFQTEGLPYSQNGHLEIIHIKISDALKLKV